MMKIEQILATQPEMLRMFGIDPDDARKDLADFKKGQQKSTESKDQSGEQEKVMNVNKELWEKWIINYKSVLTRTPEFKQLGD